MLDLERFPTSEAANRMLRTVSPIYDRAYVAKWLFQVMGLELDEAWRYFNELRAQAYPETAEWGIEYWEHRYHIAPDASRSIAERRQRIFLKRGKQAPMNPARLESYAKDFTGREATVTEQNSEYTFTLTLAPGDSVVDYGELLNTIKGIKPSHISARVIFQVDVGLVVRIHDQDKYAFPYTLSGTLPETNIVGVLTESSLLLDTNVADNLFPYLFSGLGNAGVHPEINTVGDIEQGSIFADVSMAGSRYQYPLCGEIERTL